MSIRKILHVDMDAFYASVEQRDDPAIAGRRSTGRLAREPGRRLRRELRGAALRRALGDPMSRAVRLCPES